MRTFVVGDIHGGYKALVQVLERAQVSAKDHLIFLGDFADGWSETPKVYDLLISMQKTHKVTILKGNHDYFCLNFLQNKKNPESWLLNGGVQTIESYQNIDENTKKNHINFIENLPFYYLDEKNRLFIHAGFSHLRGVEYEIVKENFMWDRTLWELAYSVSENISKEKVFYPKRLFLYDEVYIGHTPTINFGETTPMKRHNIWNVDTGAGFSGRVTILDVDTKEFWQSDVVKDLYPNEKGRNRG